MLKEVLQDVKLRGKELTKKNLTKLIVEGIVLALITLLFYFFLKASKDPFDVSNFAIFFWSMVLLLSDILNELFPYRLPKLFYFLPLDLKEKQKYLKTVFGIKTGIMLTFIGVVNGICYWKAQEGVITIGIWFLLEFELALSLFLFHGISLFQEKRRTYFISHTSKKAQKYTKMLPMLQIGMFIMFSLSNTFHQKHWFLPWVLLSILFLFFSLYYVIRMVMVLFPVLIQLGSDYEQAKEYMNDEGFY